MTSRVDEPPAYTEHAQTARNALLSRSNFPQNVYSARSDGLREPYRPPPAIPADYMRGTLGSSPTPSVVRGGPFTLTSCARSSSHCSSGPVQDGVGVPCRVRSCCSGQSGVGLIGALAFRLDCACFPSGLRQVAGGADGGKVGGGVCSAGMCRDDVVHLGCYCPAGLAASTVAVEDLGAKVLPAFG